MIRILGGAAYLPGMKTEDRHLRLRVTRRDEPDLGKLIEWVLNIAEARHRAWRDGKPDPYGLASPESTRAEQPGHLDGGAKFAPPSLRSREQRQ